MPGDLSVGRIAARRRPSKLMFGGIVPFQVDGLRASQALEDGGTVHIAEFAQLRMDSPVQVRS